MIFCKGGGREWETTTIGTFSPLFSEWCSCRSSSAGHDWASHNSSLAYSSESPTAEPPGQDFQASENETSHFQFLKHNFGFSAHSAGTAFHEWRRSNGDSSPPPTHTHRIRVHTQNREYSQSQLILNLNICSLSHLIWVSELELPLLSSPRYAVLRRLPGQNIFWFSELSKHLRPSLTRARARIAKVELGRLVPSWVPRMGPEIDISSIVIFEIIEDQYYQFI